MKGQNKILMDLCGKPVIIRTMEILSSAPEIEGLILILSPDDIAPVNDLLKKFPVPKLMKVLEGGKTRLESVYAGVIEADCEYLVIHDGARPLLKREQLKRLFDEIITSNPDAVIPAIPSTDTLKKINKNRKVIETLDRSEIFRIQTPQIIRKEAWLKAYNALCDENSLITDDSSMLELAGYSITTVDGSCFNIKITTLEDAALADFIINRQNKCV